MSVLPIVQRELRTAARRRVSFRVRWWTTAAALGIALFSLFVLSIAGGRAGGRPLFDFLTAYAFGLSLLAGVFLTADALSEEKREGTLGLLFLTDLKGYDVVLGKFAALSLNAFYCLLALVPALSLPLLAGGVNGREFWRMVLALVNALFISLATGICVSAFMRDSRRAVGLTLGFLFLLVVGLPVFGKLGAGAGLMPLLKLAWISPLMAFSSCGAASGRGVREYWGSLGAGQAFGWGMLALASYVLPRNWQQRGSRVPYPRRSSAPHRWAAGVWRRRTRAAVLAHNPVTWLLAEESKFLAGAWVVVAAWGAWVCCTLWLMPAGAGQPLLSWYAVLPFGFALKILFASQACRFFAEGRRNGALELLLCTPLTNREIIRGQALALWRDFRWPLGCFFLFLFAPLLLEIGGAVARRNLGQGLSSAGSYIISGIYSVRMGADLLALCWMGMALALTLKRPALAPGLTILYVLVLPSILCWWLDAVADLFFIAWGASRVQQDLRRLIAQQYTTPFAAPVLAPPRLAG